MYLDELGLIEVVDILLLARVISEGTSEIAVPLFRCDRARFPEDATCVEERVEQLVFLEQTSTDVGVEGGGHI